MLSSIGEGLPNLRAEAGNPQLLLLLPQTTKLVSQPSSSCRYLAWARDVGEAGRDTGTGASSGAGPSTLPPPPAANPPRLPPPTIPPTPTPPAASPLIRDELRREAADELVAAAVA